MVDFPQPELEKYKSQCEKMRQKCAGLETQLVSLRKVHGGPGGGLVITAVGWNIFHDVSHSLGMVRRAVL